MEFNPFYTRLYIKYCTPTAFTDVTVLFFLFWQLENPTSVRTVGGVTSSAALSKSTKRGVTTTSSAWDCKTASIQVGASLNFHPNLMTYFYLEHGLQQNSTEQQCISVTIFVTKNKTGQISI